MLHKTLTMISAEPYCGKTLFMLAAAISLSSGKPLLGVYSPTELRRTLFIGQDAPTWDYARQCAKLLRGYGIGLADAKELETDLVLNEGVFINDRGFREWLALWHEATNFEVLMLDSFINVHTADENDNKQMSAIMHMLKTIRDEFDCTIFFSHHTRKPNAEGDGSANYRARGATAIAASVDFHFQLARAADKVSVLMPKGRGADDMDPPSSFTIIQEKDGEGNHLVRLDAVSQDENLAAQLLSALQLRPRKRADLVRILQNIHPQFSPDRAEKWLDNTLQTWKRNKIVESQERGTWTLLSA